MPMAFAKSLACLKVTRGREKCTWPHARSSLTSASAGVEERAGRLATVSTRFHSRTARKERVVRLGDILTFIRKPAVWAPFALLGGLVFLGGCETKGLIDPGEMMRETKNRLMIPVLPSLAEGQDEAETEFANAEDVKQADLKASNADYVIGRNDLLSISITEVAGPGVESVKTTRVSESGNVSLPLIGTIKATGLTEAEL